MKNHGFTLIELVITIAVIAILAAFAFPSYQGSVERSRRADAFAALGGLQLAMEKFRGNCASFPDTLGNADDCANTTIKYPAASPEGYYTISINAANGNSYTLHADPTGGQVGDTACDPLVLTVNNANPKGLKTPSECW